MGVLISIGLASGATPIRNANEQQAFEEGCEWNQANINICGGYEFRVLGHELSQLLSQEKSKFSAKPETQDRLALLQRAWDRYVLADCTFQDGQVMAATPQRYLICAKQHIRERINLLKSLVSCNYDGCTPP
jgi:uncharacterized protein YecT (DUF1311 family)